MATIAVSQCSGGNHIHFTVTDGAQRFSRTYDRATLLNLKYTDLEHLPLIEADLLRQVREVLKAAGASTAQQAKTAIEAATFTVLDRNA